VSWETNTTLNEITERLRNAGRVLVLTHQKPDGDAAGAALAVCRALETIDEAPGRAATPWFAGPIPDWLKQIAGATRWRSVERDGLPDAASFGAVLVVDTGSWNQLEHFEALLRPLAEHTIVVDHHRNGNAEIAGARYIDTAAAAVCEPVAELCGLLLGVGPAELPREIAEPLYLGIATDTGWFKHSNVTPRGLHLAADLIEGGVRHAMLYELTEQQDRASRFRVMARAFASLEVEADGRVAFMTITRADVAEAHAGPGETGGIADQALGIKGVLVSALMSETDDGRVKVSLRSKEDERAVDVNEVAQLLGGGGHARAAGARITGSVAEAKARILDAIAAQL